MSFRFRKCRELQSPVDLLNLMALSVSPNVGDSSFHLVFLLFLGNDIRGRFIYSFPGHPIIEIVRYTIRDAMMAAFDHIVGKGNDKILSHPTERNFT